MSKFSKLFEAQDMTMGEPWQKIVSFAVPLLIGNIAQQLPQRPGPGRCSGGRR